MLTRTAVAAVVGGTASLIGGGKFENGAVTGAFSRLFNDEADGALSREERVNSLVREADSHGVIGDPLVAPAFAGGIVFGKLAGPLSRLTSRFGIRWGAGRITKHVIERKGLGLDLGRSRHVIEKLDDATISVTLQVERTGTIIHQHQTHIGKYGAERRFPDEWVEYRTIE